MISISLANATLILGATTIFSNLAWEIQHDQKIGLIGPNGAGKSSLFKLIMGEYTAEPGVTLARARGVTVGYLPQQPEFDPSVEAFELALDGNPRVAILEKELRKIGWPSSGPGGFCMRWRESRRSVHGKPFDWPHTNCPSQPSSL